jgi:hypothetical protein
MTIVKRQPISMMLIVAALFSVASAASAPAKDASTTYRCHAKDAVSLLQDGMLSKLIGQVAMKDSDKIVVDVASEHVTIPNTARRQEWVVETTSIDGHDYVLYPKSYRQLRHTAANVATNFIRIHATKNDPQPRYVVVVISYLVAGTCELLQQSCATSAMPYGLHTQAIR